MGNELTRHYGTQQLNDENDKELLRNIPKGRVSFRDFNGSVIQTYSIPIVFEGQTFFKQKLYEVVDESG